jgi:hypothetical protein
MGRARPDGRRGHRWSRLRKQLRLGACHRPTVTGRSRRDNGLAAPIQWAYQREITVLLRDLFAVFRPYSVLHKGILLEAQT